MQLLFFKQGLEYHIFFEKKGITEEAYKNDNANTNEKMDTSPVSIYWEIEPLIVQIDCAARCKKKATGDDLICLTFKKLGHALAKKEDLMSDYRSLQLLKNRQIREAMLDDYIREIEKRTSALINLFRPSIDSESIDSRFWPDAIYYATQKLDTLLAYLIDYPQEMQRASDMSLDLDILYDNLMTKRMECEANAREQYCGNNDIPVFGFEATPNSEVLCKLFREAGYKVLSAKKRKVLEEKYNAYMIAQLKKCPKYNDYEKYIEGFDLLRRYTKSLVEDVRLEKNLTKYFSTTLQELFDDINNADYISSYCIETRNAENMATDVINDLAPTAMQRILFQLHNPFRLLRISRVVQYFSIDEKGKAYIMPVEKVDKLLSSIKEETRLLVRRYPNLPLICGVSSQNKEDINSCIKFCKQLLLNFQINDFPLNKTFLEMVEPESIILQVMKWSEILLLDCYIVAYSNAKESISEILEKCRKMTGVKG